MHTIQCPTAPPEKYIDEHLQSVAETNRVHKSTKNDEIGDTDPEINLILLKRKLGETEFILNKKRAWSEQKRNQLHEEWKMLELKEQNLQTSFIRFNRFVRENTEKRERALKKMAEEKNLIEEWQVESEKLQAEIKHLADAKILMDRKIREYNIYEEFLTKVTESAPQFKGVRDLVDRIESLLSFKEELMARQDKAVSELENARKVALKCIEERVLEVMGLNNHIADLRMRFDAASTKAIKGELLLLNVKEHSVKNDAQMKEVTTCIWNLYVHMCTSRKMPIELKKDNVEGQMSLIKEVLREIRRLNTVLAKKKFR